MIIFNRNFTRRLRMASLFLAAFLHSRCASDKGGQQQGETVNGSQQGQSQNSNQEDGNSLAQGESMNNAVEGGSNNNFGSSNNFGNASNSGQLANNPALGASINNVPLNNPSALTTNQPTNTPLNQTTPVNQGAALNPGALANAGMGNGTPTNSPPETGGAPATPSDQAPQQPAPTTSGDSLQRAAASPFVNPHMNWPGKGKVKYVTRNVTRHAAPNGPVVGEFEQGEHPLIYQNGNWVELHDGSFVKGNGLSEKPVGYNKGKKSWR